MAQRYALSAIFCIKRHVEITKNTIFAYFLQNNRESSLSIRGEGVPLHSQTSRGERRASKTSLRCLVCSWSLRLSVRTRDFHSLKRSSTLLGTTNLRHARRKRTKAKNQMHLRTVRRVFLFSFFVCMTRCEQTSMSLASTVGMTRYFPPRRSMTGVPIFITS